MKNIYIKDIRTSDILTQEMFAIQKFERLETKDKKPYVKLILIDKTGQINANIWNGNIPNIERGSLQKGSIVLIDGKVEEYRGALQINILKVNKVSEKFVDEFVEGSTFPNEKLEAKLNSYIDQIQKDSVKAFINKLFENQEIKSRFIKFPAAEYVHHDFQGGLLEHVVEMLDISASLKEYYPEVNYDYVIAGIIFHDIGKLYELERVGVAIQRTTVGYLIGHLSIGYEMLIKEGEGVLDEKDMLNLKHIILSHHGELEYGSPVKPATIEAMMVHKIDMLSSHVRIVQRITKSKMSDELGFTEYDRLLGTKIYLGNNTTVENSEIL